MSQLIATVEHCNAVILYPTGQHYFTRVALACALLLFLLAALLLAARWFRRNASRLSSQVARYAATLGRSPALRYLRAHHPKLWEFIVRRFETGEYLGLHLTLGLFLSIAALWLFAGITEDVLHHAPLTQFDATLLEWFHAHSTASGVIIFLAISWLGSPLVLSVLGAAVAISMAVRRSWILFAGWIAALIGAGFLDELLKEAIRRPRPPYAFAILQGHSFSFPSGHAMASLIAYGMAAYVLALFWKKRSSARIVVIFTSLILVLAIGISRLYLGVHYFSDVVAGYAAGAVWLSVCITGIEIARRQPKNPL
jgi:undecaprenyl-diphosphatase